MTEHASLIFMPDIPNMLQTAALGSPEFDTAIKAFESQLDEALRTEAKIERVLAPQLLALRTRFRDGKDLNRLAWHLGTCRVVALFGESISVDEHSLTEGPMALVNRFAAEHMTTCEHCLVHYGAAKHCREALAAVTDPSDN